MAKSDGTVVIDTLLDVDGINDGSKKINKKLDSIADKLEFVGSKLKSALGTGLKTAVKIGVASLTTMSTAVVGLGKIGLEYNSQIEDYTVNFTTILGDAEKGAAKVQELKELAASTPFALSDLAESTQTLLTFNVASDESTDILSMLGDISLGNADKLSRLSTAYSKVDSTGKLTGETLQQMIEAGFNPALVITQETGETMEEFNKRVSDGGVSVDELRKAMVKATSKGGQFNNGMKNASKTMSGLISTLKDNAISLVGDVFKPISDSLTNDLLPKVIDSVGELQRAFDTGGVNGLVEAAGNMLGDYIAEFSTLLPKIGELASGLVTSLIDGIKNNAGQIATGAAELVETFVSFIVDAAPEFVDAGFELAINLANGLATKLPELITDIFSGIGDLIGNIVTNLPGLFEAGVNLVLGIIEGIWNGIPQLFEALTGALDGTTEIVEKTIDEINDVANAYTSFADVLSATKPQIADYSLIVNEQGQTMSDLARLISQKEQDIVTYISDAVSSKGQLYEDDIQNIKNYMAELQLLYEQEFDVYRQLANAEIIKIRQELITGDMEMFAQRLTNVEQYVADANNAAEGWYSGEIARIESLTGVDAAEKQAMLDNATAKYNEMIAENNSYYVEAHEVMANGNALLTEESKKLYEDLRVLAADAEFPGFFAEDLKKMNYEADNAYLALVARTVELGGELDDATKANVALMMAPFENLPEDYQEFGDEAMRGLVRGLEAQIPELEDTSEMTASEIVGAIKDYLQIASPSRVMRNVGKDTVEGIIEGIKDKKQAAANEMKSVATSMANGLKNGLNNQKASLTSAARRIADSVTAAFKARLQIHSPSRVFRDEIGAMMAKGLGEGFEAQMPKELRAMNAAINLGAITTPMMASGTVVPPQSSYSVSRNSNSGIADALSRQISAAMGNQNRTYQFVAQIDGATVFNKVIREGQMHQVSSGRNPFEL